MLCTNEVHPCSARMRFSLFCCMKFLLLWTKEAISLFVPEAVGGHVNLQRQTGAHE